jgi:hypothetical protein
LIESNTSAAVGAGRLVRLLDEVEERLDDVDRHRKDDGRILLGADLRQCLQVAQLHRGRNAGEDLGGIDEGLRGLERKQDYESWSFDLLKASESEHHGSPHFGLRR